MDEIYGYQLAQRGPLAILDNSLVDPHPPLYYLIQWGLSAGGRLHSEWAWRWLPMLSGTLAVVCFYALAVRLSSLRAALLSGLLFALSPTLIYFSQEARATSFVLFLTLVSMHLLRAIEEQPDDKRLWGVYGTLLLVGLYCNHSFGLIVGVQLLYLLLIARLGAPSLLLGVVLMLCYLPALPVFLPVLMTVQGVVQQGPSANLILIGQSLLGGDVLRYGISWAHPWLLGLTVGLGGIGVATGLREKRRFTWYLMLQLLLPLLIIFGVLRGGVGLSFPAHQSKLMVVLLPSLFLLVAQGIESLLRLRPPLIGRGLVVGIYLILLFASAINIQRYWEISKSPEAQAVLWMRAQVRPRDVVISLHYSPDAALSFYMPALRPHPKPDAFPEGIVLFPLSHITPMKINQPVLTASPDMARSHPRIWLLDFDFARPEVKAMQDDLVQGCTVTQEQRYPPFRVRLLEGCP
ncbi:MAG: glycosyltransferase family 39 protein [Ardenticatenales bacterium]|nr:glycosyltransferase family 39 protein [Ardenticatenales bacterium]